MEEMGGRREENVAKKYGSRTDGDAVMIFSGLKLCLRIAYKDRFAAPSTPYKSLPEGHSASGVGPPFPLWDLVSSEDQIS